MDVENVNQALAIVLQDNADPGEVEQALLDRKPREWEPTFLLALAEYGTITDACRLAAISAARVHDLRASNPGFRARFERAKAAFADKIKSIAIDKAIKGWEEPKFWQGVPCGTVHRFSERLLLELFRHTHPEAAKAGENDKTGQIAPNILVAIQQIYGSPTPQPGDGAKPVSAVDIAVDSPGAQLPAPHETFDATPSDSPANTEKISVRASD